ncbi:MAG: hypothetical protein QQN62_03320 [Nitrosopumilus sp.]
MDRIKRISYEVLEEHKSMFGEDFVDNKKALDQISIIRSKSLKNKITGYITRLIKRENREEKVKQERITSSQSEKITEKEVQPEISESSTVSEETLTETVTEKPETVEEKPETVEEKPETVEEKPETVEEKPV